MKKRFNATLLIASLLTLLACAAGQPGKISGQKNNFPSSAVLPLVPSYRTDAPGRYVVQRGDTLWGIAGRFLQSPARWKEIWYANPQIKQPSLIYPGDIIAYVTVNGQRKLQLASRANLAHSQYSGQKTSDGRPIYRLSPTVREKILNEPIPTLPREIVYPFMTKNRMIEVGALKQYPYVITAEKGNHISLSTQQEVFAKGEYFNDSLYDVFREAKQITHPETGELLGVEVIYIGQLTLTEAANSDGVATLSPTDSVNPLMPMDILIPTEEIQAGGDLFFHPQLATPQLMPVVIKPVGAYASQAMSQFDTLLISSGHHDGAVEGMVFKIVRANATTAVGRNGELLKLPNRAIGYAMVYQTYDRVSYALVLEASDVIYAGDRLMRP